MILRVTHGAGEAACTTGQPPGDRQWAALRLQVLHTPPGGPVVQAARLHILSPTALCRRAACTTVRRVPGGHMADIPLNHPRYQSLQLRNRLIDGFRAGLATEAGLLAHGRGEAFDYLLGERTNDFALEAIRVASALIVCAKHPVISIN